MEASEETVMGVGLIEGASTDPRAASLRNARLRERPNSGSERTSALGIWLLGWMQRSCLLWSGPPRRRTSIITETFYCWLQERISRLPRFPKREMPRKLREYYCHYLCPWGISNFARIPYGFKLVGMSPLFRSSSCSRWVLVKKKKKKTLRLEEKCMANRLLRLEPISFEHETDLGL